MTPIDGLFWLIVLVLERTRVSALRRAWAGTGGAAVCLALVPLGLTLLFGMMGLLGSALYVGGLYKASAR